jgi:hypothetical protein
MKKAISKFIMSSFALLVFSSLTYATSATVFQAAGPNASSIQSSVDQFRIALGGVNNGNAPGPLAGGRREINWDGGGSTATSPGPTPFDVFLIGRGTRYTTSGTGFVQAPASGLATIFGNPSYVNIFQPFSNVRLFSPMDSNVTDVYFFIPGGGEIPATTNSFGVVLTDVDLPDINGAGRKEGSTFIQYFDSNGDVLFSSFAPFAPGDRSLSFFGIVLEDSSIARVRITTGNVAPGKDDEGGLDVVVMDDVVYGEPQRTVVK